MDRPAPAPFESGPDHPGETDHEHHHRKIQGGAARAAVFGVSDGLVSNVSIILGVAGASPAPGIVRLAGLAGLVGGAFSMAAGEYGSMRAQTELLERELELERIEIGRRPEGERRELAGIYRSRGVAPEVAEELASHMMRDPELALETHAREELGIDPSDLGSPVQAAVSSFLAFVVGALVPLVPWFVAQGSGAMIASVVLTAAAALAVGIALAVFTGRSWPRPALRQLVIAIIPAAVTFAIGNAVGISVT
ncbi:MAG: VIT1/CCC1 transporter family protein [Acidimicrobiales bacterium]